MDFAVENIIRRRTKRQIIACLLICITIVSTPFEHVSVNFLTPYLDYWCDVKEISHCSIDFQKSLIRQSGINGEKFDFCFVSKVNWTQFNTCREPDHLIDWSFDDSKEKCSTGFRFDLMQRYSTVTSKFGLVCDKLWLLEIISPLYTASLILGSLLSGIADTYGRKKCLMVFIVLHAVGGITAAFGSNIYMFILGRMIVAVSLRGIGISALILMIEIFPSKRIQLACWLFSLIYSSGSSLAALVSFLIRDYQWLQFTVSVPFVFIIFCWYAIPESPSWLISKNKINEANNELKLLAKSGNYSDELETILNNNTPLMENKKEVTFRNLTFLDLFKYKKLFYRTTALCIIMSTYLLTLLGVTFNMGLMFGDVYLNQAVCGIIEVISLLTFGIFLFNFERRKYIQITLFLLLLCHVSSLIFSFFTNLKVLTTITTLTAKVLSIIIMLIVNVYTGELFPTEIRQQASGFCNAVAGIASISSPIIGGKLKLLWSPAPYIVFGSMSILSIIFAYFLPETMGRPLPQTLNDVLKNDEENIKNKEDSL